MPICCEFTTNFWEFILFIDGTLIHTLQDGGLVLIQGLGRDHRSHEAATVASTIIVLHHNLGRFINGL